MPAPATDRLPGHRRSGRRLRLVAGLLAVLLASGASAARLDPQQRVERALESLRADNFSLARAWLAPVLIHPRISAEARAWAWYYEGLSFHLQGLYRSAVRAYQHALEFDSGHSQSLSALAYLTLNGLGTAADPGHAHDLYIQAARQGLPEAQTNAGVLFLTGQGKARDLTRARYWLTEAAEAGEVEAMLQLGRALRESDDSVEAQPAQARMWLERAATAGSTEAAMALGFLLRSEELGNPDLAAARANLTTAAEAGETAAQSALAYMLMTGQGGDEDLQAARHWYERAAAAGDANAMLGLGWIHDQGLGVDPDPALAMSWYQRAAEAGNVNAQVRLGFQLAANGQVSQALTWLRRAAQQDHAGAQNALAWLLATSPDDTVRDGALAVAWAERAVEQVPSAANIDTLAAAYAEVGRFDDAVSTQQRAIDALDEAQVELREEFKLRLARYQAQQPWRE